jgi:putative transposase
LTDDELITLLEAEGIPVTETCRILDLSRASFYRRRTDDEAVGEEREAPPEETALTQAIRELAALHPAWGYRRITSFLCRKRSLKVNRKRVRRIMRACGLSVPVKRYKANRTETRSKPRPTKPNQWWGTDMTKFYIQHIGWVYLVVVLDWYTKRAIGHALSLRPLTSLWLQALTQAVETACPQGSRTYEVNLMSDNGSQPTSLRYENAVATLGINHVTTSYNNPKGNADTERFMRTFKEEVVWPTEFESLEEATAAVETFFRFYNQDYPHSTLGGLSPIDFQNSLNQTAVAA